MRLTGVDAATARRLLQRVNGDLQRAVEDFLHATSDNDGSDTSDTTPDDQQAAVARTMEVRSRRVAAVPRANSAAVADALATRLQLAQQRLAFASLAHVRLGADSVAALCIDTDVLVQTGARFGLQTEQRHASEDLLMVLRSALDSAPPRDSTPAPAAWAELERAMQIASSQAWMPRNQFVGFIERVTEHMRGWRLDAVMLERACCRWSVPHRHDTAAIGAFLRAAGVDNEFRQAMSDIGDPTEIGVRAVLLDFYQRNHPE
jgi:hypothetical protein